MKRKSFLKKTLSLFLVLTMMISSASVFAQETTTGEQPFVPEYNLATLNPFDYALLATGDNGVDVKSAIANINANVYSGGDFKYSGSQLTLNGECNVAGKIIKSNASIQKPLENIVKLNVTNYIDQIKAMVSADCDKFEQDKVYQGGTTTIDKDTLIKGSLKVSAPILNGSSYIIAENDIEINTSLIRTNKDKPFILVSENGNININSSMDDFNGIIYAPNGTVKIHSTNFSLNGKIIAKNIIFESSSVNVTDDPALTEWLNLLTGNDIDSDSDGLSDDIEKMLESDPNNDDTDGDGLKDGYEFKHLTTELTLIDSDSNGISDYDEDYDEDGLTNGEEQVLGTLPGDDDTDADGISDGDEVNIHFTNPINIDTDDDSLTDDEELMLGLNPNNPKTDGITPDAERKFQQKANDSIKDDLLLASDNWLISGISGNVPGDISKNVLLEVSGNTVFSDNRSVLSDVIDITTTYTVPITLTFSYSQTYTGNMNNLSIVLFADDDLKVVPTAIDKLTGTISGEIIGDGTYFVVDLEEFLRGIGVDVLGNIKSASVIENDMSIESSSLDDFAARVEPLLSATAAATSNTMGKADIAFVLDVTGSMDDDIRNVSANINDFVDNLKSNYNIDMNFSLITYNDYYVPIQGEYGTRIHKNNSSNWFTNINTFKAEVNRIANEGCGYGAQEVFIDGLGMAKDDLNWRRDAAKFIVLLTDEPGATQNNYGYSNISGVAEALGNDEICVSVITESNLQSKYRVLWETTDGLYANIRENFSIILLGLANKIGEVTNKGDWVLLSDYQAVRLDGTIAEITTNDSDDDRLTDKQELGHSSEKDLTNLIQTLLQNNGVPHNLYTGKTSVTVWNYFSNPVLPDTDFDGIDDNYDSAKKSNKFSGKLHGDLDDNKSIANVEFKVDYSLLMDNSTIYKDDLSVFSSLLAADIYDCDVALQNTDKYKKEEKVMGEDRWVEVTDGFGTVMGSKDEKSLMSAFGLKNVEKISINPDDYAYDKNDITEFVIGHRTVVHKGLEREVVVISVRGTNATIEEWSSNFDVGAHMPEYYDMTGMHPEWTHKLNHKGFDVATNRVISKVNDYFSRHALSDSQKSVLITGHSRGAAVANLLGAHFEKNVSNALSFTYTFAAPNPTTDPEAKKYKTIFNILNDDDIVPLLPLEKWGFTKYGDCSKHLSVEKSYENKWGKRQNGTWEWLMGTDYNNNGNYNNTKTRLEAVANNREDSYKLDTTGDGKVNPHNERHITLKGAKDEKENIEKELKQQGLYEYCSLSIQGGGFLTPYYVELNYSPAFLMKVLANMAVYPRYAKYLGQKDLVGKRLGYDLKGKYREAKASFAITSIGGVAHPHTPETYYLMAYNRLKPLN